MNDVDIIVAGILGVLALIGTAAAAWKSYEDGDLDLDVLVEGFIILGLAAGVLFVVIHFLVKYW